MTLGCLKQHTCLQTVLITYRSILVHSTLLCVIWRISMEREEKFVSTLFLCPPADRLVEYTYTFIIMNRPNKKQINEYIYIYICVYFVQVTTSMMDGICILKFESLEQRLKVQYIPITRQELTNLLQCILKIKDAIVAVQNTINLKRQSPADDVLIRVRISII